jgi:peptide/nickel transport system permease protein
VAAGSAQDELVAVLGEPAPVDVEHPRPVVWGRRGLTVLISVALAAAGVIAIVAGTAAIHSDRQMVWRAVLVIGGLVAIYQAIARFGRAVINPGWDATLWLSVGWLAVIASSALFAPLLPLGEASDASRTLIDPIRLRPDLFSDHPLGTNTLGLDLLARVIYGARVSLTVSTSAVLIGLLVGGTAGVIAGYRRGAIDSLASILANSLLAFPPLILLLALASVLDRTSRNMALILGFLSIPIYLRLARANTLALKDQEFVIAAQAMGSSRRRIIFRELVPNVLPGLLSYGLIMVAVLVVAEASLSFLGLGIQQPSPSWGNMIAEGENGLFEANPHLVLVPGFVLFATVFSFNIVGEKLRRRWDRRQVEL